MRLILVVQNLDFRYTVCVVACTIVGRGHFSHPVEVLGNLVCFTLLTNAGVKAVTEAKA